MTYHLDFGWLFEYLPLLLGGLGVTVELTVVGGVLGILLGIACAWSRALGPRWLRPPVTLYVELIRNTPFMVQLFFIFFGLPAAGVRMSGLAAAHLAMILNLGAYAGEIVRAGIEATPRGQFEAGASLALTPFQTFRHVVLVPALERIWPALASQVVIVMLGSAVVSQVAAQDLTFAANFIQSRNFRAFETYFLITGVYLGLSLLTRQTLFAIGRKLFPRGAAR